MKSVINLFVNSQNIKLVKTNKQIEVRVWDRLNRSHPDS